MFAHKLSKTVFASHHLFIAVVAVLRLFQQGTCFLSPEKYLSACARASGHIPELCNLVFRGEEFQTELSTKYVPAAHCFPAGFLSPQVSMMLSC